MPRWQRTREHIHASEVEWFTRSAVLTSEERGDRSLAMCGAVNRFAHFRAPVPLDRQNVIRMQHDTVYSAAIVDISAGAKLTLPDAGDRYISAHIVNADHFTNAVFHDPGVHRLTTDEFDTDYVQISIRILDFSSDASRAFGPKNEVDPIQHLINTASGWGPPELRGRIHLCEQPQSGRSLPAAPARCTSRGVLVHEHPQP